VPADAERPDHDTLPKIRVAADYRGFVTADGKPFVPMGINYYARGTGWAPRLWKKFNAQATRQDFARMKALGVNCVRVFLSHGSFFMQPDALLPEGLAKFDQFLAIAEEAGIYVHPTGPDGWEEFPAWAQCDRIADDTYLVALETFWRQFGRRYRGRSVIFAYDLRNEPGVGWNTPTTLAKWNAWLQTRYGSAEKLAQAWRVPPQAIHWGHEIQPLGDGPPRSRPLLEFDHFREGLADQWTRRQVQAIKSVDPQALVTVGFLSGTVPAHETWGGGYACFQPQRQAKFLDFLEVHLYPNMSGYTDEAEQRNLAYCESVAREVAAAGKPVVIAEFGWYGGGPIDVAKSRINKPLHLPAVSEEQQAQWCRKLIETTQGFATGWLNWGLYDHPEANDCAQRTGLFTVDGKPKAWAREFHELATVMAGRVLSPPRLGPRPALDWDSCITSSAARREFAEAYYQAFQADRARPH
jgi:hypothetical protein